MLPTCFRLFPFDLVDCGFDQALLTSEKHGNFGVGMEDFLVLGSLGRKAIRMPIVFFPLYLLDGVAMEGSHKEVHLGFFLFVKVSLRDFLGRSNFNNARLSFVLFSLQTAHY